MSDRWNILSPSLRPQQVSAYLGIKGSELPRLTSQTIGAPETPPVRRGASSEYSPLDALLMRLGQMLLDLGLLPHRTRVCVQEIRHWFKEVIGDPDFGTSEDDMVRKKGVFLIARQEDSGFVVQRADVTRLSAILTGSESYRPQTVINVDKFVGRELERLVKSLGEK